jgi:hypothetical protein
MNYILLLIVTTLWLGLNPDLDKVFFPKLSLSSGLFPEFPGSQWKARRQDEAGIQKRPAIKLYMAPLNLFLQLASASKREYNNEPFLSGLWIVEIIWI